MAPEREPWVTTSSPRLAKYVVEVRWRLMLVDGTELAEGEEVRELKPGEELTVHTPLKPFAID